jgi:hypothetical protein
MSADLVSAELREVEKEVDRAYEQNALTELPFSQAVWYYLAACEEVFIAPLVNPDFIESEMLGRALADTVINGAAWPLRWLSAACSQSKMKGPPRYDDARYSEAWALNDLGADYLAFESAYSYASWGLLDLEMDGRRIRTSGAVREDARWDAYDRLADQHTSDRARPDLSGLAKLVGPSVRVEGDTFSYDLNPKIMRAAFKWLREEHPEQFTLPSDWALTTHTLGDYAAVLRTLWLISMLHFFARVVAAAQGCVGLGYNRALVVMTKSEIVARVVRYSGLNRPVVREILTDLTFGARGVRSPDPALQPIVELDPGTVAWSPSIIGHSALERNLLILMNRIPEGRKAYSHLSSQREGLFRDKLLSSLQGIGLRFWHGEVPGWTGGRDIDLAVISDEARVCILFELKSFVAPADPREIRDRSSEIERGIDQVRQRRAQATENPEPLLEVLGVASEFQLHWAVLSETSVGGGWVQVDDVAVVRGSHLVSRMKRAPDLPAVGVWLDQHNYLPKEGEHYRAVETDVTISDWTLDWFGIEPLTNEFQ